MGVRIRPSDSSTAPLQAAPPSGSAVTAVSECHTPPGNVQQSTMIRPHVEKVDCLVIGAGVVGLAVARALAQGGREVLVCERGSAVGQGTTSRNSEVIHAGLYYQPGSLKARLCVQGRKALYQYCGDRGIPHRRCGKLVVASSTSQLPALRDLHKRALACGVGDVRLLGREEARAMEPDVLSSEALFSPSTGILDSHALTLSLQGEAEAAGAVVSLRTPVHRAEALSRAQGGGLLVSVEGDLDLRCRTVVNCAGLSAVGLARRVAGCDPASLPKALFAKGNYFRYAGTAPFRHLVYPLPEPNQAGLGVHATLDLAGQVRFGPDVEWIPNAPSARRNAGVGASAEPVGDEGNASDCDLDFDYSVDPTRRADFSNAIRRYWPDVDESKLVPDYSGIRPKLVGPDFSSLPRGDDDGEDISSSDSSGGGDGAFHGARVGSKERQSRSTTVANAGDGGEGSVTGVKEQRPVQKTSSRGAAAADFVIQGTEEHGVDGLVNLFGIESPGLTASLAIAEHVAGLVKKEEERRGNLY